MTLRALTLVETLAVLAILAVVAAIAFAGQRSGGDAADQQLARTALASAETVYVGAETAGWDGAGDFPDDAGDLAALLDGRARTVAFTSAASTAPEEISVQPIEGEEAMWAASRSGSWCALAEISSTAASQWGLFPLEDDQVCAAAIGEAEGAGLTLGSREQPVVASSAPTVEAVGSIGPYGTAVLDLGAVAYWRLAERDGDTAADAAEHPAGLAGAADGGVDFDVDGGFFAAGAATFNGADGRIVVDHDDALNLDAVTLALWVRGDAADQDYSDDFVYFAGKGDQEYFWQVDGRGSEPYLRPVIYTSTWYSDIEFAVDDVLDGEWRHLALTFDPVAGELTGYLDGEVYTDGDRGIDGTESVSGSLNATTEDFSIGWNSEEDRGWFDGEIGDVAVFDDALSSAEVAELFDAAP